VSSLVLSGPAGKYLKTNGQTVQLSTALKSALVAQEVAVSQVAGIIEVVNETGSRVSLVAKAFGSYAAGDAVLLTNLASIQELVGADRQPVVVLSIPAGSLVA
jgi:hypothetical protein